MSTPVEPVETQSSRERSWIYLVSCLVLVVLVVVALVAFRSARETQRAQEKADELIAALEDAGARTPDRDQIVRVLGDDGGAACANPNAALTRAALLSQLANGATGPGARPVIADSRAVKGQLLIIEVYCPDELDDFREFVDDLKTDDVASG
jgi:Tfp pilus assembly protein FimT